MKEDISLGELLLEILKFLRRNFIILILALVVGGVLGSLLESNRAPKYESELILCSDLVEHNRLKEILDEISRAVNEKNFAYLSELSGFQSEDLAQLKSLDVKVLVRAKDFKVPEEYMDNRINNCVRLSCSTEDPTLLPKLQELCLKTVADNNLVNKLYENKKSVLSTTSSRLEEDILLLRENRKKYLASEGSEAASEDTQNDLNEAYVLKTDIDERLGRLAEAYIAKPFNEQVTATAELAKQGLMYAFLFLGLAIAFAFFRELKL